MKTRVALFFGGHSAEHEISVISARNIAKALSPEKYELHLVGIADNGRWTLFPDRQVPNDLKRADEPRTHSWPLVSLVNVGEEKPVLYNLTTHEKQAIDVAFPVLHGPFGEDGSIQGLFRMVNLPMVGCGVLASAIGMDKEVMKRLLHEAGLPSARYRLLRRGLKHSFDEIVSDLGLPFFIKPSNMGSSIGVHKIKSSADFDQHLADTFKYDEKVLAETFINGREIEVAVLGGGSDLIASSPGEVIPQHEFYSYEAKYLDEQGAILKVPAELSAGEVADVKALALRTFSVLCCDGMARVDFFMTKAGKFFINEINTIPGFTSISQYPKLMEISGVPYRVLIERLIDLALRKFEEQKKLQSKYMA
ncbi:MAG: D-alanine--D-alanine ligase A [Bdellovibrio sp.]|nr:MAG: D-alanine--D-alanine ligase A [Bdellovibrio sp.]